MDPAILFELLTTTVLTPVLLDSGAVTIAEATEGQLKEIRKSLKKNPTVKMAKKVVAILDLGKELQDAAQAAGVALPAAPPRSAPSVPTTPEVPQPSLDLALMPFPVLRTVKPEQTARDLRADISWNTVRSYIPVPWLMHGRSLFYFFRLIVILMPVAMGYALLIYFFLCCLYLLSNPRLMVRGFFTAIFDLAPGYFSFAFSEMLAEGREQLSSRIR
jgi:hypothetical protein